MMSHFLRIAIICSLATASSLGLGACASASVNESNSAEAAFKVAEEFDKDERYEEALTKYAEVKNKHPYSKYAVESELRMADIHYKRENFVEAQTAYQLFKDFHPKHPRMDYVTYRLAMSYYGQIPATADRDLSQAPKAIQFFDEVMTVYPQSSYVAEAKDMRDKSYRMLAEKESYIGNFYFKRDMYDSALGRYQGLLKTYPNHGYDEEALYRAGICAFKTGNKDLGVQYMKELLEKFPQGSYAKSGKNALEEYGSR